MSAKTAKTTATHRVIEPATGAAGNMFYRCTACRKTFDVYQWAAEHAAEEHRPAAATERTELGRLRRELSDALAAARREGEKAGERRATGVALDLIQSVRESLEAGDRRAHRALDAATAAIERTEAWTT